jgi:hypothetical protein
VGELPATIAEAIKLKIGAKGVKAAPAGLGPAPAGAQLTCHVDPDTGVVTGLGYAGDAECSTAGTSVILPVSGKAIVGVKVAPAKLGVPTAARALTASITLEVVDAAEAINPAAPRTAFTCGWAPAATAPIDLPLPKGTVVRQFGTTRCLTLNEFAPTNGRRLAAASTARRRLAVPWSQRPYYNEPYPDVCEILALFELASSTADNNGLSGLVVATQAPPPLGPPGARPSVYIVDQSQGVYGCSFTPPVASPPTPAVYSNCALVFARPAPQTLYSLYPTTGLGTATNALLGYETATNFVGPPFQCSTTNPAAWQCSGSTGTGTNGIVGYDFALAPSGNAMYVAYGDYSSGSSVYTCALGAGLSLISCAPVAGAGYQVFGVERVGSNLFITLTGSSQNSFKVCPLNGDTVGSCTSQALTVNGSPVTLSQFTSITSTASVLYVASQAGAVAGTVVTCPISGSPPVVNTGVCASTSYGVASSPGTMVVRNGFLYIPLAGVNRLLACPVDETASPPTIGTCLNSPGPGTYGPFAIGFA